MVCIETEFSRTGPDHVCPPFLEIVSLTSIWTHSGLQLIDGASE